MAKLNCKSGNYQCGKICQSSTRACRKKAEPGAREAAQKLRDAIEKQLGLNQQEQEPENVEPLAGQKKLAISQAMRDTAAKSIADNPPVFMTKSQAKQWDKTAGLDSMINGYAKQQVNYMANQVVGVARPEKANSGKTDAEKKRSVTKDAINEVLYAHDAFTKSPNEVFSGLYRKLSAKFMGRDPAGDDEFWGNDTTNANKQAKLNNARVTRENSRAYLAATAYNQEYTRNQLGDNFTLNRGVTGSLANEITKQFPDAKPGDTIEIPVNSLSSWSPSADEARKFANDEFGLSEGVDTQKGYVLQADFSAEDVAFNSDTATHFHAKTTYGSRPNFEIAILSGQPTIRVKIAEVT